ncbi:hypothetical protein [Nostoc sp.]
MSPISASQKHWRKTLADSTRSAQGQIQDRLNVCIFCAVLEVADEHR